MKAWNWTTYWKESHWPRLCCSVLGEDLIAVRRAFAIAQKGCPDMYELRIDYLPKEVYQDVQKINQLLSEWGTDTKPVILSLRTAREGGRASLSNEEYRHLVRRYAAECICPLLDLEIYRFAEEDTGVATPCTLNQETLSEVVDTAHAAGKAVIMSHHDFKKTPPQEEIIQRIFLMRDLGADLPKVAYMPQREEDVYTLLESAGQAWEESSLPLIAISMGDMGRASRVCGSLFGSFISFTATADAASAPGQMETSKLRKCIDEFYKTGPMTGKAENTPKAASAGEQSETSPGESHGAGAESTPEKRAGESSKQSGVGQKALAFIKSRTSK